MAQDVFSLASWNYLIKGVGRRLSQSPRCPSCGLTDSRTIDRKFFYALKQCQGCKLNYRFPAETAEEMSQFYQDDYEQAGMTTDLPSDEVLKKQMDSNFAGTEKDFSRVVNILNMLGIKPGARVLDYGANWGYGVHQLRKAGYNAEGYELSKPRAAFAEKLAIHIETNIAAFKTPFDVVYSGHVLEHVPNPRETILEQIGLLGESGFVVGHTPNGSAERQQSDPHKFHLSWGRVHPVLLTGQFITTNFPDNPSFIAGDGEGTKWLKDWDKAANRVEDLSGYELFFAMRKGRK
jgi:2-polyprenyl-3-methyl-5-hydroxy-6-metoxy-1,4-benzoquinol methylase